jgi:hypothetical protein
VTNPDARTGTLNNGFNVVPDITAPVGLPSTPSAGVLYSTANVITFTWSLGSVSDPESGIAGYYLQAGNNPAADDASVFNGYIGAVSSKTFTGVNEGAYYARVRAKNPYELYGGYTPWSAAVIIDTTPPTAAVVESPTHPENNISYLVVIEYNGHRLHFKVAFVTMFFDYFVVLNFLISSCNLFSHNGSPP